jgi:hypothetical protein
MFVIKNTMIKSKLSISGQKSNYWKGNRLVEVGKTTSLFLDRFAVLHVGASALHFQHYIIYRCVTKGDPWFLVLFNIVCHGLLLCFVFWLVMDWVKTAGQAMCEPLRKLMERAEAQEAVRRELRQELEAIRRAHERRFYQEQQMRRQQREMAGRGRDAGGLNIFLK